MDSYEDERGRLLWKLASRFAGFSPDEAEQPGEHLATEIQIERKRVERVAAKIDAGLESDDQVVLDPPDAHVLVDALLGALGYLDILEARAWAEYWARGVPPGSQYEVFGNALNFVADHERGRGRRSSRPEAMVAREYVTALTSGEGGELRTPWLDELIGMERSVKLPPRPTPGQACRALTELFGYPSYDACRQALIRMRDKIIAEWERIEALKQEDPERGWHEWRRNWRARLIDGPDDFPVPPALEPTGDDA